MNLVRHEMRIVVRRLQAAVRRHGEGDQRAGGVGVAERHVVRGRCSLHSRGRRDGNGQQRGNGRDEQDDLRPHTPDLLGRLPTLLPQCPTSSSSGPARWGRRRRGGWRDVGERSCCSSSSNRGTRRGPATGPPGSSGSPTTTRRTCAWRRRRCRCGASSRPTPGKRCSTRPERSITVIPGWWTRWPQRCRPAARPTR